MINIIVWYRKHITTVHRLAAVKKKQGASTHQFCPVATMYTQSSLLATHSQAYPALLGKPLYIIMRSPSKEGHALYVTTGLWL